MNKIAKQVLLRLKGVLVCQICHEDEADFEGVICFKCREKIDKQIEKCEREQQIEQKWIK